MKCFGKAAEKCHKDSLSSIVASCAWGKKTTVGMGASFEILWEKIMISDQEINVNAFDILQMIRSTTSGKAGSDCLFDGDYDLLEENENRTLVLSPEQDLEFEPIFEGNRESQSTWQLAKHNEDRWDSRKQTTKRILTDGTPWKTNHELDSAKPSEDEWNSWKTNHEQSSDTATKHNEEGWDSRKTNHEQDSG